MTINIPTITLADFSQPQDQQALRDLMQHYATDPMGGGEAIAESSLQQLPQQLMNFPGAFTVLAWHTHQAVGLINCFMGFSTFKGQPLVNIHDIVVLASARGQGINQQMMDRVVTEAKARGCCKITLEVLSGNDSAQRAYKKAGFAEYQLDPQMGHAEF